MSRGVVARIAWVYWVVCAGMILAGLVLLAGARGAPLPPEANPWGAKAVDLATLLIYPTLAALILARRPHNVVGWLFCAASFAGVFTSLTDAYAVYALWAEPGSLPFGESVAWVAGAIGLLTVVLISTSLLDAPRSWESFVEFPAFLAPPVAVGIAMLRHRLYDVDLIINQTIVYVSLTALLAVFYLGGVALLQELFRSLTGQETQLAVVASTLAIAALFRPLRGSIQGFVDRRFYRRKYDAEKTLGAFSERLRAGADLDTLGGELVGMVRETMQPEHASLWLKHSEPNRRTEKFQKAGDFSESSVRNVVRNGQETVLH
jgi:hypothetical protein